MNELNPQQVVQWLRQQARRLNDAAEAIEAGFGKPGLPSQSSGPVHEPTPEEVKTSVSVKQRRVAEIAKELHATPQAVRAIIDNPANGLERNQLGWVKLKGT